MTFIVYLVKGEIVLSSEVIQLLLDTISSVGRLFTSVVSQLVKIVLGLVKAGNDDARVLAKTFLDVLSGAVKVLVGLLKTVTNALADAANQLSEEDKSVLIGLQSALNTVLGDIKTQLTDLLTTVNGLLSTAASSDNEKVLLNEIIALLGSIIDLIPAGIQAGQGQGGEQT